MRCRDMTGPKLKIRANTAAKTSRRETPSSLPPGLPPTEIWLLSFSVSQSSAVRPNISRMRGGEGAKGDAQPLSTFTIKPTRGPEHFADTPDEKMSVTIRGIRGRDEVHAQPGLSRCPSIVDNKMT